MLVVLGLGCGLRQGEVFGLSPEVELPWARWLGHSSPAITLGYYAHLMPEAASKGRTAIDGLLGRQGDLHVGRNSPDSPQGWRRANPAVWHLRSRPWIARLKG